MKPTDGQTPEGDSLPGGPTPSEADVQKARVSPAKLVSLEKAREAKAKKHPKDTTGKAPPAGAGASPQAQPIKAAALALASRQLVRFCWWACKLFAFFAGGQLPDLSDDDLKAGAEEAAGLVSQFAWLASFLAFVGFPLWLFSKIAALFTWRPKPASSEAPAEQKEAA